jgi:hypothetical protein
MSPRKEAPDDNFLTDPPNSCNRKKNCRNEAAELVKKSFQRCLRKKVQKLNTRTLEYHQELQDIPDKEAPF